MSKAQHTPGPWSVAADPEGREIYIRKEHGGYVHIATPFRRDAFSTCEGMAADFDPEELTANARLIAAAPDLLAALQGLVAWAEFMGGWEAPIWAEARAVIRRATQED